MGVFDSGIGGLTVYRALRRDLPTIAVTYFGDTARVPYGTKSGETVVRYSLQIARYLVERGSRVLVVACNTASSYSLPALKESFDIPIFGVVEPGARAAVRETRNGVVGVIGTAGTIASGSYQRAIADLDSTVKVVAASCRLFVPLVEEGWLEDEVTYMVACRYLAPLIEAKVDTLVLGCTHYPLLRTVISRVMGDRVAVIDSSLETAAEVKGYLETHPEVSLQKTRQEEFLVTDSAERFAEVGRLFLLRNLPKVKRIHLPEGD